jgi:hypothetical protein
MESIMGYFPGSPIDWIVLGGIFVVVVIDSLHSGVGRAVAASMAMPLAHIHYLLVEKTVTIGTLPILQSPVAKTVIFALFFFTLYFLVRRTNAEYLTDFSGPIRVILAGTATAIIFLIIWLMEPALNQWWMPNEVIHAVFAEKFHLFWLLGAYAALSYASNA